MCILVCLFGVFFSWQRGPWGRLLSLYKDFFIIWFCILPLCGWPLCGVSSLSKSILPAVNRLPVTLESCPIGLPSNSDLIQLSQLQNISLSQARWDRFFIRKIPQKLKQNPKHCIEAPYDCIKIPKDCIKLQRLYQIPLKLHKAPLKLYKITQKLHQVLLKLY